VKNRLFGHLNGECFTLKYSPTTGCLTEVLDGGSPVGSAMGFGDETGDHHTSTEF
jgi:hypothetical protein